MANKSIAGMTNEAHVAIYCRLSREDDVSGTSTSIKNQIDVLDAFCKDNNFNVFDHYCDDGYSGMNYDRPNFKRMMDDIDKGRVQTVIVKDVSRLGRDYVVNGKLIEEVFPSKNIRFISVSNGYDSEICNPDQNIMLPFMNVINQFYVADCSKKIKQVLHSKAVKGEYLGSVAAYGYKKSTTNKHVLVIDENTAPIVERIFDMVANQNCGCNKIARILKDEKILTPTAYAAMVAGRVYTKNPYNWNLTSVGSIIHNKVYLGHVVNCKKRKDSIKSKHITIQPEEKWIIVENTHSPIVSEQLWNEAQRQIAIRKRNKKDGEPHIFSGLVKCDTCGHGLSLSPQKNGKNALTCNTYKKEGKEVCSIHFILCEDLYDIVLNDLRKQIRKIRVDEIKAADILKKRLNQSKGSDIERLKSDMKVTEKRIAELDGYIKILYKDRVTGVLTGEQFIELSRDYTVEKDELKVKLSTLIKKQQSKIKNDEGVDMFINEIRKFYDAKELNAELLHKLIDKIEVGNKFKVDDEYRQKVKIYYKFIGNVL